LKRRNIIQKQDIERMQSEILKENFENKNIELSGAIADVVSYNKVLESVKKAINSKNLESAISIINSNINTEQNWQQLLLTFNELHPDFFSRLRQKHNNLTENDMKLSALLRMNFKSREIAGVLNIGLTSVDKSRQRLRKKINIDAKADLFDYLKNI
jgi:hypothetical protein